MKDLWTIVCVPLCTTAFISRPIHPKSRRISLPNQATTMLPTPFCVEQLCTLPFVFAAMGAPDMASMLIHVNATNTYIFNATEVAAAMQQFMADTDTMWICI